MKRFFFAAALLLIIVSSHAQGVKIGVGSGAPDASSVLEVESTTAPLCARILGSIP